ncbi:MAG: hypothetical protein ACWIPJ_10785 [Polaribacter sp.]
MKLTTQEEELIAMIRNYKKTYPKSSELEYFILRLFENLLYDE